MAEDGYGELRDLIQTIRSLVRDMSSKSGVPIEPKMQTELIDACSAIPGVIGGFCPGAGGYDAIALLVKSEEKVINELEATLKRWQSVSDSESGATTRRVSLLGAKQELEGVRFEDSGQYREWVWPS